VAHTQDWRAIWHSPIPGLTRRAGTVTEDQARPGTLTFTPTVQDLDDFMADPAIHLRIGDVVAFTGFVPAGDTSSGCQAVFNETPNRFELSITGLSATHLDLAELPDTPSALGFHPDCPKFGAVVEVRTAADQPWLVLGGDTVKGRTSNGATFTVRERRFDYPRSAYSSDPDIPPFPSLSNDAAYTLRIGGPEPTAAGFLFSWTIDSGLAAVGFRDTSSVALSAGYATAVYSYSSPRNANLVFTSVTGVNEVLQADPTVSPSGVVFYR